MGSSVSNAQSELTFCKTPRDSGSPHRLCLDEDGPNMGGLHIADRWNVSALPKDAFARQRDVLTGLIGGDVATAEETATLLMSTFGSVGGVLSAQPANLFEVVNKRDLVKRLVAARAAVLESLSETVQASRFEIADQNWQKWIVGLFKGLRRERVHLAYLDADQRFITDKALVEGDLNGVNGSLRQIVHTGLGLDASGLVLMHNHPSGNPEPSRRDIAETRRIASLLDNLDLRLEDHLIVAGNTIFSMRKANFL